MTEAPIIDIVIPNRNKADFLPRTLASLRSQTETRWRAIVIDGDSTDGSLEILRSMAAVDPRFVVQTARPASVSGLSIYRSWNHGLLQVRAPFFAVLTSDDTWEPTWLKSALEALDECPTAIAAAARAVAIDTNDVVEGPTVACRQFESSFPLSDRGRRVLSSNSCALRALLLGPIFSTIHSLVFRSSILGKGVIFAEDLGYIADVEYYLHACLLGDIVYDMSHSAFFRIYGAQESSAAKGPLVSLLWRKLVDRNLRLVAKPLGIPLDELSRAVEENLSRHLFVMTKPDWATFKRSKALAMLRFARACFGSPRLGLEYLKARADRDRFMLAPAAALASELSTKYGFA
jgi:glycosyltransferase involved in cell wall biosynthesis